MAKCWVPKTLAELKRVLVVTPPEAFATEHLANHHRLAVDPPPEKIVEEAHYRKPGWGPPKEPSPKRCAPRAVVVTHSSRQPRRGAGSAGSGRW
jgi:hypothetical protein